MERYLLFDSECTSCAESARMIERHAGDWLRVCSLRHPRMQELLARAKQDWQWEPTLLVIDHDNLGVYTGLSMALRVIAGVGPLRAISIAQTAAGAFRRKADSTRSTRRAFIAQSMALLGWLFLPKVLRPSYGGGMQGQDVGELFGGFVILPDGAPIPDDVSDDYRGFPIRAESLSQEVMSMGNRRTPNKSPPMTPRPLRGTADFQCIASGATPRD